MVLKIGDIEIYSYDEFDKDQEHLLYVLNNDADFLKYVTKKVLERLKDNINQEKIMFNHSYLVKYQGEYVGYIRLEDLKINGTLNIEWAISPEYRNQNLATKIVKTISDYLLNNLQEVIKVRGVIERRNYASKKVALNSGFLEENRDDFYIYFSKERK